MTIMVKANTAVKNPTGVALVPLVAPRQVKRVHKPATIYAFRIKPSTGTFLFLSMISLAVVVLGFTCGMIMFREYLRGSTIRYRGTCTITSTKDDDYILINAIPYTKVYEVTEVPETRMYSSASDMTPGDLISKVIEELAIEDAMETITVHDGRRAFDIIHDFDENTTSIRNDDRCFIMNMIRDFVLEPRSLVQSFHNETLLDLTHAHSFFRAEIPAFFVAAVPDTGFSRNCFASKPIYRLNLEDSLILTKRSLSLRSTVAFLNEPPLGASNTSVAKRDFLQFSGNHLQRITISNIDDVLQYEARNVPAHPKLRASAH